MGGGDICGDIYTIMMVFVNFEFVFIVVIQRKIIVESLIIHWIFVLAHFKHSAVFEIFWRFTS